jgi:hypothetical protein
MLKRKQRLMYVDPPSSDIAPVNGNDTIIRHTHLGLFANESGIVRQRPANHIFSPGSFLHNQPQIPTKVCPDRH